MCPIRKNTKYFYGHKKMWVKETTQRAFQRLAHAQLWFSEPRAAACRRRSSYCLLSDRFCIYQCSFIFPPILKFFYPNLQSQPYMEVRLCFNKFYTMRIILFIITLAKSELKAFPNSSSSHPLLSF